MIFTQSQEFKKVCESETPRIHYSEVSSVSSSDDESDNDGAVIISRKLHD